MSNAGVRLIINESWVCVADAEGQTGQPSAIIKGIDIAPKSSLILCDFASEFCVSNKVCR